MLSCLALAVPSASPAQCCPPVINTQPQSQTVNQGTRVTFWVTVSSTTTPTYQWRFNGANIPAATGTNYIIGSAQGSNAGGYSVVVDNASGSVTSLVATLTVHLPPTITTQPQSQTKLITSNVTFTVAASGDPTLTYQWRFNGTNLAGKTATSCTLTNLQLTNAGNYSALVANSYGSATSAVATLTVTYINLAPYQPPGWSDKIVISTTPNSYTDSNPLATTNTLYVGFSVVNTAASGTGFTNELYLDGMLRISPYFPSLLPNSAVTLNNYSLGMLSEGIHTLRVKADSSNAINESDEGDNEYTKTFVVLAPPAITNQPVSQIVTQGATVVFSVGASGTGPLAYQWRYNDGNLLNATGSSFTRTNVQPGDAGAYSVIVSNAVGVVTSSNAILIVDGPLLLAAAGFATNGFQLIMTGPIFTPVVIEASTNLAAWTPIYTNNTGPGGLVHFTDPDATGLGRRFYRGWKQ